MGILVRTLSRVRHVRARFESERELDYSTVKKFQVTEEDDIKMEGCMSSLDKYLLFTTNFLIFILGTAVFGLGIWVVVDEPSFLDLFDKASEQLDGESFNVEIYTSAAYILLVVSALVVIISFFGCCGAFKESKCMLGTYFTLILAMFIVMVVGAVLGYSGDLDKSIKEPLKNAMSKYRDDVTDTNDALYYYKGAWNTVQTEMKCCGVDDARDWGVITEITWSPDPPTNLLAVAWSSRMALIPLNRSKRHAEHSKETLTIVSTISEAATQ